MNEHAALQGRSKTIVLSAAFVLSCIGLLLSGGQFAADRYVAAAENLLDDPETPQRDVIDLAAENAGVYQEASRDYEKALVLAPLNADYAAGLAELFRRVDIWQASMATMGATPAAGFLDDPHARDSAFRYGRMAVDRDPAGPYHRFSLGRIYAQAGRRDEASDEFHKAADAYPINAPLRYAVVVELLLNGYAEDARKHAAMLAKIDDSYKMWDERTGERERELRSAAYESVLARSYLYKAMEVTWRTSGGDPKAVLSIVPDNEDARETARLFLENRDGGELPDGRNVDDGFHDGDAARGLPGKTP